MRRYIILLIASVCVCHIFVRAQEASGQLDGFGVEESLFAGKIIRHTVKFTAPIPALSTATDIHFLWQTYGHKPWQQRRNYPMVGAGITYTNYGNNAVFGRCIGAYADLEIPLIRGPLWEWDFRLGDGLGYVTRKYQTSSPIDTVNDAIGTHLNDFAIFVMDLRYHLNDHWHLEGGINFTHISNADYHQPNLGVNMLGGHVGVRYFPGTCHPRRIVRQLPKLPNRWLIEARGSVGYTEARAKGNPELPTYTGSVYVSRRWISKNKLFFGHDYDFSNSTLAFLRNYGVDYGTEKHHSWEGAFFAGNEFLVGHVGIWTQMGVFYQQTFLKRDPVYEKWGINYYIINAEKGVLKELFLSALLKADLITAEYAEFGLGMAF
jgi:Lipid A 3-O-deacylase (PagL)